MAGRVGEGGVAHGNVALRHFVKVSCRNISKRVIKWGIQEEGNIC
jgi:hypothetical protein